ncbi:50S ribosomal protein L18 [Buchnera aphidicola (Thelaxes californica)]|uniref:Large ribosomal subunit protein uL18 n=1 Tax=Buchnera aphidicola (Thelaxes californica) TaxID=1315998 RepID=A0A4D6YCX6_9GAMM|nr:50S ribosomal protein L18 [Buchnera aphidicola]QCI26912.1 50S ribosomal protein L18 [Buchnera aphidicola (Thelaxes californica)]
MKRIKNKKIIMRKRRSLKLRSKIRALNIVRLVVHRTSKHIYAQIIAPNSDIVLTSASTLEKIIKNNLKYTGNTIAAKMIGNLIAERAIKKGIKKIAFDRSGFKYHGRVKKLAEAARKTGLIF